MSWNLELFLHDYCCLDVLISPARSSVSGGDTFDLILAADVVWLDELVEPLVRTLERLTAGWPSCSGSDGRAPRRPAALSAPPVAAQELGLLGESAATAHADGVAQKCQGAVAAGSPPVSPRLPRPRVGPRVLLAYQWRSQRTGDALLEGLEKAFHVREIQAEVGRKHRNISFRVFWFRGLGEGKNCSLRYHALYEVPCFIRSAAGGCWVLA